MAQLLRNQFVCLSVVMMLVLLLLCVSTTTSSSSQPVGGAGGGGGGGGGVMMPPHDVCPPNEIPASANVTDLSGLTFWGQVSDGRVWFVEFYADWCRGCKRVSSHVSMLADALAETHPHIVVARVNCGGEGAEHFCDQVIRITRTPCFKVYFQGRKAIDYDADFYFFDMMMGFITETAANLKGFSLPSSEPQQVHPEADNNDEGEDDDDDEYE